MGRATTLNGHVLGKYPVSEGHGHLGKKIAIVGGIAGAIALGALFLTKDGPKNTAEEVQKATRKQQTEMEMVKTTPGHADQTMNVLPSKTGLDIKPEAQEERYFGFTKNQYLDAINKKHVNIRSYKITDIKRIKRITDEEMESALRNDFSYGRLGRPPTMKEFLIFNRYKKNSGYTVYLFGGEKAIVFEKIDGTLKVETIY